MYVVVMVLLFAICFLYEELGNPSTYLAKIVRKHLGHHDLHDYLGVQSLEQNMPYDNEVPECDYRTMTPKRFFNDYVK